MAYKIDGTITKNFKLQEFCNVKDAGEVKLVCTEEFFTFVRMLQKFRDVMSDIKGRDYVLNISSGYRTRAYNRQINGAENSAHLVGRAADITSVHPEDYELAAIVWHTICVLYDYVGGINFYSWGVHLTNHEDRFGHSEFQKRDKR